MRFIAAFLAMVTLASCSNFDRTSVVGDLIHPFVWDEAELRELYEENAQVFQNIYDFSLMRYDRVRINYSGPTEDSYAYLNRTHDGETLEGEAESISNIMELIYENSLDLEESLKLDELEIISFDFGGRIASFTLFVRTSERYFETVELIRSDEQFGLPEDRIVLDDHWFFLYNKRYY